MKIATLGPQGTCSEEVAIAYLRKLGLDPNICLSLCESFEDAASKTLTGQADRMIVPAAYTRFHNITFDNIGKMHVVDVLYSKTPAFLLAGRRELSPAMPCRRYSIAAHPSPAPLLKRLSLEFDVVDASSNSTAAWMAANGEADLCLTNQRALSDINSKVALNQQLELIEYFGTVDMVWAVLELGQSDIDRNFWSGDFERRLELHPEAVTDWLLDNGVHTDLAEDMSQSVGFTMSVLENETLLAGSKPRALFIDNDPEAFALIPDVYAGWDWVYANSIDAALAAVEAGAFSVAMMDIGLVRDEDASDQSGTQLLTSIRRSNPEIPILMITGMLRSDDLAAFCFRLGALDYMKKPLDIARLSAWMELLERRWWSNSTGTTIKVQSSI